MRNLQKTKMANCQKIWRNQEKKRKHIIEDVLISLPYEKRNFEVSGSSNAETASANARFCSVPEIIDPVFAKTSQNARFLLSENERFGLVFVKTGSINSGTVQISILEMA